MTEGPVNQLLGRTVRKLLALTFAGLVAALAFALVGCERTAAPPLVEVLDLAPREVESGERLELVGRGFPQGRTARVTFEGVAYRPGEPPVRGVSFETDGVVSTLDRLDLFVREPMVERVCGMGERAAHATFRGDVEVAFPSTVPGAPPLVARLRNVVLDIMPSSLRASELDARAAEGKRLLEFLGVIPAAPTARGIPIEQVNEGSRAARAGLQVGDVIAAVDGVHALSLADVAPASFREVELTVRHGDSGIEDVKSLALFDYAADRIPSEYAPALLVVGFALAVLVLLVLPGPPSLAALEFRIAIYMRHAKVRTLARAVFGEGQAAVLSLFASAIVAALALTPYVIGSEVDGGMLLAIGMILLVWSRVTLERGWWSSTVTGAQLMLLVMAIAGATTVSIMQVGAIELSELVRMQGGAPWQFLAARHPSCAIAAGVFALALLALVRTRSETDTATRPSTTAGLLERAGLLLLCALFVMVFLGGWRLPGVAASRGRSLALLGAMVVVVKTWLAFGLVVGGRLVMTSLRAREMPRLFLRRLMPGLVVAAALVLASRRLLPSMAVETAVGGALTALFVLFLLRLATRVRAVLEGPEPHASPFI